MITGIGAEVGSALDGLVGTAGPEKEARSTGSQYVSFSLLAFGCEHASSIFALNSADLMRVNIKC